MAKYELDDPIVKRLLALDATPRFRIEGPTFAENETTGKMKQTKIGGVWCDIFDRGEVSRAKVANELRQKGQPTVDVVPLVSVFDQNEDAALLKALAQAEASPRPTAKQASSPDPEKAKMAAELEKLKAQVAELTENQNTGKPRGGIRKRLLMADPTAGVSTPQA